MVPLISILIDIIAMSLLSYGIQSAPSYVHHDCGNYKFTPNGTYQSDLNNLLTILSSDATANKNGFNYSVTSGSAPVYGLYMCRGDVTVDTCSNCVSYATHDVVTNRCPRGKEVVIWYDECILRYSDSNIIESDQLSPMYLRSINTNISNGAQLDLFIEGTMAHEMAIEAASGTSGKKIAMKEVKFSRFDALYSLVQCTPDLTFADCVGCIDKGVSYIPAGRKGATVLLPSCILRYETYPFYRYTAPPPPFPTPSPPPWHGKNSTLGAGKKRSTGKVIVRIAVPVTLVALLLAASITFLLTHKIKRPGKKSDAVTGIEISSNDSTTAECLLYELNLLQAATNNFSDANKLGEGGFGSVYRGKLENGKEIAVKRLSQRSSQGVTEFKTEVVLVANLQHKNLVMLLGFCLAGNEKLLVYEFVPNKSLDYFLFDPEKQVELDWTRRYNIIQGIARGLLYLHEGSRIRIIHRDIKPSNILLDADMTPKIADFGLAEILGLDQLRGNTKRVAGTIGYMAPEYAFKGEFSESSDVYSFGIMVLEIISGQKINKLRQSQYPESLVSYAWKKWKDNEPLDIMEQTLRGGTYSKEEVIRCVHLALLCVQEEANARPSMSRAVLTLSRQSVTLPQPRNPAFCSRTKTEMNGQTKPLPSSANFVSMTEVCPR